MTTTIITECPDCHSRFRVTEGQVKLAQGQVRCGSCLTVFDARIEARRLQRRLEAASKNKTSTVAQPSVPKPRATGATPVSRPRPSPVPPRPASEATSEEASPRQRRNPPADTPSSTDQGQPVPEPIAAEATPAPQSDTDPDGIPRLQAEPIVLEISEEETDPFVTAGWMLACLLALMALGGQYLWFERATLALRPELQPIYVLACERLPCQLNHTAVDAIETQQMVVRPHPAYADALTVDIRLLNDAAFSQPFPALELTFTDVKGQRVAQRLFRPFQYLTAESYPDRLMPAGTPIELQLEITDPGAQAVSYTLDLKPDI
ncbi:MAG: hypothetical protein CMI01_07035 [Oceanospirillaceae bacterium]|nr:hypothetical protein [Oceanospirillaceae bacterium]